MIVVVKVMTVVMTIILQIRTERIMTIIEK